MAARVNQDREACFFSDTDSLLLWLMSLPVTRALLWLDDERVHSRLSRSCRRKMRRVLAAMIMPRRETVSLVHAQLREALLPHVPSWWWADYIAGQCVRAGSASTSAAAALRRAERAGWYPVAGQRACAVCGVHVPCSYISSTGVCFDCASPRGDGASVATRLVLTDEDLALMSHRFAPRVRLR